MASESGGILHFETSPVRGSAVDNLSFSMDSLQLGDSTRSLLSPLYNRVAKDEVNSNCGDDVHVEAETVMDHKSTPNDTDSYSSEDFEDVSRQGTVKEKRKKGSSFSKNGSYSSYTSPNSSSTPNESFENQNSCINTLELNPWEKWLLDKVIKDHARTRSETRKKKAVKELNRKERAEKVERERKAELNRQKWLEMKHQEERIRNELKRRQGRAETERKLQERERIHEKAVESYKKWSETKQNELKEQKNAKRKEKLVKNETKNERKQQSEDAYKKWLEKAKEHPKSAKTHFGYLSGKVIGYYDWTCYPMPTYNNPNPWVAPKAKRRAKCVGKIELQAPSPPLLFKELEQREQISKQNNSKLKSQKHVH